MDVQINMISADRLKSLNSVDKISLILDDVKRGQVVILENGLDPFEEARLIESTMAQIGEVFSGIEIQSYPHETRKSWLDRLTKKDTKRMTVIGPADRMKTIRREKDVISALIT
jgi:hypothetical protein